MISLDRFHGVSSRNSCSDYAKLVHDALTGLAFVDDSQLDDVHWIRAGVDIDRPRLSLELTALAPGRVRP